MAVTIAMAIQKGGTAKTHSTVNLATLFAADGKRVLVVDVDPQANSTYLLTGIPIQNEGDVFKGKGIYDAVRFMDVRDPEEFLSETKVENVYLLASNRMTNNLVKLMGLWSDENCEKEERILSYVLLNLKQIFDVIIIDTPPSLDCLTMSAIYASDFVLIPCKAEDAAMQGVGNTLSAIEKVRREDQIDTEILGIFLTIVERNLLTEIIREELRKSDYADKLLETEIRKGQAINEAYRYASPVVESAPKSNPAQDYVKLYEEILQKLRENGCEV